MTAPTTAPTFSYRLVGGPYNRTILTFGEPQTRIRMPSKLRSPEEPEGWMHTYTLEEGTDRMIYEGFIA